VGCRRDDAPVSPAAKAAAGGAVDTVVTLVAGAALAVLLARLRVPGGMLLGAMVASALLHGSGLVEGGPPVWLQATGFVATGALIGSRFRGTSLAVLRGTLPGAVGSVLLALALSAPSPPSGPPCWACPSAASGSPTPRAGSRRWR
jgi:uncharacterized membrane protein AbrB (regulator of aidB expression)